MRLGKSGMNVAAFYYSGPHSQSPETRRNQERHLDRLKSIKPVIDNHADPKWLDTRNNAKTLRNKLDRQATIDRENQLLLTKLARIIGRTPELGPQPVITGRPNNPFSEKRERGAWLIMQQNQEISTTSVYDRKRMAEDYERNRAYLRTHSHYPPPK